MFTSDAFATGTIRSGTDYSVYTTPYSYFYPTPGVSKEVPLMHGLDLAFYKGRSRYHTKYDSIPWLEGGKKSLWAMMESSSGIGTALANEPVRRWEKEEREFEGVGNAPVYFDRKS